MVKIVNFNVVFCPKRTPEYQLNFAILHQKVQGILTKNQGVRIGLDFDAFLMKNDHFTSHCRSIIPVFYYEIS